MPELGRVRQNVYENYAEGQNRLARLNRRSELVVTDFYTQMALDGRTFGVQIGSMDTASKINTTASAPSDTVVWALTDVDSGTTIIPIQVQVAVQRWVDATLIDFMLEADMGKVRFSAVGGGGEFTAICTRGDSPRAAASTSYVNLSTGAGVTAASKSTIGGVDGSYEFYQTAIEVNVGDAADAATNAGFRWCAKDDGSPPVITGPGSFLLHFAVNTNDIEAYGNYRFIELPSGSVA